jgi:hypothetical protein
VFVQNSTILGWRHQLKRPVRRAAAVKLAVLTGAEIDRAGHLATPFFAAQAGEDFRKGEIAAPLGKQAHVSTPESYCSGWWERKCSRDASKKAPESDTDAAGKGGRSAEEGPRRTAP